MLVRRDTEWSGGEGGGRGVNRYHSIRTLCVSFNYFRFKMKHPRDLDHIAASSWVLFKAGLTQTMHYGS